MGVRKVSQIVVRRAQLFEVCMRLLVVIREANTYFRFAKITSN